MCVQCSNNTLIIDFERDGIQHQTIVHSTDPLVRADMEEGPVMDAVHALYESRGAVIHAMRFVEAVEIHIPC